MLRMDYNNMDFNFGKKKEAFVIALCKLKMSEGHNNKLSTQLQ